MAKYTILTTQREVKSHIVYQVKYENGTLGGWIESEENLSQEGNCIVKDDAAIFGNARVEGNAIISEEALVFGNAIVNSDAKVFGQAKVFGYANVTDEAEISGNARIRKNAWVTGKSRVYGSATITENAALKDCTIFGEASISGDLKLINCKISGDVELNGNEIIRNLEKSSSLSQFEQLDSDLCEFMLKVDDSKSFSVRDEIDGGASTIKDYFHPMSLSKANFDGKATLSIVNLQHKPIFTITKDWDGIIKVFRVSSSIQRWIDINDQVDATIIINSIDEFKRYIRERIELAEKARNNVKDELLSDVSLTNDVLHFNELKELL